MTVLAQTKTVEYILTRYYSLRGNKEGVIDDGSCVYVQPVVKKRDAEGNVILINGLDQYDPMGPEQCVPYTIEDYIEFMTQGGGATIPMPTSVSPLEVDAFMSKIFYEFLDWGIRVGRFTVK